MSASAEGGGALSVLGRRLARHGAAYALGSVVGAGLMLVQLVVLTRLLPIDAFGELAVLVVFAGLVTLVVRICGVQGSLVSAFRGDDEGETDAGPGEDEPDDAMSDGSRRLLGTGLALSLLATAVLTGLAAVSAVPLGNLLIGSEAPRAVAWAALAGGLEAVWRLLHSVPRYERRPAAYVLLDILHAGLRLVAVIALVEAGLGLEGAIAGLALGSAVSLLPALVVSRHRFRLALDRDHARLLIDRGRPLAFIAIGFWVLRDTDVLLVSRLLPSSDVGLYRAASRVALPVAYLSSALLLAWGPLTRGPLRGALHRERAIVAAGARLVTNYWLLALILIVGLALASPLLIRIVPAAYGDAGPVIPGLALATAAHGAFLMIYRTARFPQKARFLRRLVAAMMPLYAGLALLLIPSFGLYGAAGATAATASLGAAALLIRSQPGADPLPLPWRRLASATVLAAASVAVGWVGSLVVGPAALWRAATIVAFPVLLVVSGALPRRDARALIGFAGGIVPSTPLRGWPAGPPAVPAEDLALAETLARRRRSPGEVAAELGETEDAVLARFVAVLRRVASVGEPSPLDGRIARYLLDARTVNARDRAGHRLALQKEVGALEVDALAVAFDRLGRTRPGRPAREVVAR